MPIWTSTASESCYLPALLSSFVCDFCARFKIGGTNFNFFLAQQLAIPSPSSLSLLLRQLQSICVHVFWSLRILQKICDLLPEIWDTRASHSHGTRKEELIFAPKSTQSASISTCQQTKTEHGSAARRKQTRNTKTLLQPFQRPEVPSSTSWILSPSRESTIPGCMAVTGQRNLFSNITTRFYASM